MSNPRANQPRYRLLSGPDNDAFLWRVSEALEIGYHLYGAPSVVYDRTQVVAPRALVCPEAQRPEI